MYSGREWVIFHRGCGCLCFVNYAHSPKSFVCPNCGVRGKPVFRRNWNGKLAYMRDFTVANRRSKAGHLFVERFGGREESVVVAGFETLAHKLHVQRFFVRRRASGEMVEVTIRRH